MFKFNIDKFVAKLAKKSFEFSDRDFETVVKHRAEIIPDFLLKLDNITKQDSVSYNADILCIIFLLSDLEIKEAFPTIIKICRHCTEDDLENIFSGYSPVEELNKVLSSTYNGDFSLLSELIEGSTYSTTARSQAISAMNLLYEENLMTRDFLLKYYASLFEIKQFNSNPYLMGSFICYLLDIEAKELRDKIEDSYHKNLVDTGFVTLDEAMQGLEMPRKKIDLLFNHLVENMPKVEFNRQ